MIENQKQPNAHQSPEPQSPEPGRAPGRAAWPGVLTAVAVVLLMACGGEDPAADAASMDDPGSATAEGTATAAADEGAAEAPADAAATDAATPAAAGSAKPAPKVTSLDGGTVAAGDLRDAYFHWKDEIVTVAAYPASNRSTARWRSGMRFAGVAEEDAPQLLDCRFGEVPDGKIEISEAVVLRGKVTHRDTAVLDDAPPRIKMEDCEVVSTGGEMPAEGDPWSLGAEAIPVTTLHDAMMGWQGKTVKVSGYYKSSGYSSAVDSTDVNLAGETRGKLAVKCRMAGKVEVPASLSEDREGVVVEGTLGKPGWSDLLLEDCRVLNRS